MRTITKIYYTAFCGLTVLIIISAIVSFVTAVSWIGRPFPGFLLYQPAYVGSFSSREWPGKQGGLRYLDRILSVDGQSVQLGKEVLNTSRLEKPGTPIRYLVRSNGETHEAAVPVDTFELTDFFIVFFPTFAMGLAIYVLGVIVYMLKPNTRTSWVFLIMCFGLGIYGVTGFEIQSSYSFVRLHYLCACLFPACFLHFGLIFPERKRVLIRFPMLEYLIYTPAFLLCLGFQVYTSAIPEILS